MPSAQWPPSAWEPDMPRIDACYVCRCSSEASHAFYDELCPRCGDLNLLKRNATADLDGFTALVTGGRVKIGFETALKLLRGGATVAVTSRFAEDARRRFERQVDYDAWSDRLRIYPADFRVIASVEQLLRWLAIEMPHIDILINNAAQTVRRPPAFYRHLLHDAWPLEPASPTSLRAVLMPLPSNAALMLEGPGRERAVAMLSQVALLPGDKMVDADLFPQGVLDNNDQQEDRRPLNSWMMHLEQVQIVEFLEVLYINVVAPFLLCSRLKRHMRKEPGEKPSFIVNVSAMEGNFSDPENNPRHPHTNMGKAAVNMMTRTCAMEFRDHGIWMNAVDPGWITNERPYPMQFTNGIRRVKMAIDQVDGAARICDPIFRAVNDGDLVAGLLFKNYEVYPW